MDLCGPAADCVLSWRFLGEIYIHFQKGGGEGGSEWLQPPALTGGEGLLDED